MEVQDNFVNKGKVEQIGSACGMDGITFTGMNTYNPEIKEGSIVLFAKYSPDTQEIEHEGKKMKIVRIEDVLAVL